jgi:Flp pilus assembly protein TadG
MLKILKDQRAYSSTFWALFIGMIFIPLMALTFDIGRYLYAKGEVGKAADAAAVGAAMEINWRAFRESGDIQPTGATYAMAQHYANTNNDYLARQEIWPRVRSIQVNAANSTVYVSVEADLSVMFPSIVPQLIVEEGGEAQVRSFRR